MSNPAVHGGIASVHVGPVAGDRYAIAPNGRVLKAVEMGWKAMPGLSASVVRAWPVDNSPAARFAKARADGQAAHLHARQRQRETPLLAKVRKLREGLPR